MEYILFSNTHVSESETGLYQPHWKNICLWPSMWHFKLSHSIRQPTNNQPTEHSTRLNHLSHFGHMKLYQLYKSNKQPKWLNLSISSERNVFSHLIQFIHSFHLNKSEYSLRLLYRTRFRYEQIGWTAAWHNIIPFGNERIRVNIE